MSEKTQEKVSREDVLRMTTEVVAAYVGNNVLPASQISEVIGAVHRSLSGLHGGELQAEPASPAVPIRRSVKPDFIVCLEDGKKLKMLKRYLRTKFNMTPDEYRAKWGLPSDYPMVAPNYSKQRSEFAKKIGLGRRAGKKGGRRRGRKSAAARA